MGNKRGGIYALVLMALLAGLLLGRFTDATYVAKAQTADNRSIFLMEVGKSASGTADLLYVLDCEKKSLCVYRYTRDTLSLLAARTITYDTQLPEWNTSPSVKEMKKKYEEWLKKQQGENRP